MYISKIRIKNFKCFKDTTIKFEQHFNLIIGKNNSGKSTIFEAMRLWQLAFYRFLKERTHNKGSSFRSTHYFSFTLNDLAFLRLNSFKRLFHTSSNNILIQITLNENDSSIDLPIEFTLTTEELNLRFSLFIAKTAKESDGSKRDLEITEKRKSASEIISKMIGKSQGSPLKNLVLITYISPIFQLPTNEPLYSKGYIREMLHQSRVANVLRNLIHPYAPKDYQIKAKQIEDKNNKHLTNIEKQLDVILSGTIKTPELSFTSDFKENEDTNITIYANNNVNNSKVELSQLGSGTINLLNILSVLAFGDSEGINLNILLLDEPDSHLHSNHQIQLFKYLKDVSLEDNKQMFIITHNHELISCADKVIYISGGKQVIQAIPQSEYCKILEDMATNSDYYKVMVENNKLQEELLHITKPTLYCEGSTDVTILKEAFRKLYNKELIGLDIIDGNSANRVAAKLSNANKDVYTFGLFDSDAEGLAQYNAFKNNGIVKTRIADNLQRLDYKVDNNTSNIETKTFAMKLPVPNFRRESAKWFCNNTCIEYMFEDVVLKKYGVKFEKELGNSYEKFVDLDNQAKPLIQKWVKEFDVQYFEPFRPIFEDINKYVTII